LQGAPDPIVALERARWLDELIRAVSEAQRIAWRLGVAEGDSNEARDLYGRLESVRDELELLRLGDWAVVRKEIDPIWLENLFGSFMPMGAARGK
jgi:hypothetical protein